MYKGFYNLSSAMLTHQRNLNYVADNMTNVSTQGWKQDRYAATTFDEVLYSRIDNDRKSPTAIGNQSYIRTEAEVKTDFTQGLLEPTGLSLDFAINGDGFFAVQDANGAVKYTRMGSFTLDNEGYLCLSSRGRVLDAARNQIQLVTDKVYGGEGGIIYNMEDEPLTRLGVFNFEDLDSLEKDEWGMFTGTGEQLIEEPDVLNGYLERSNTDLVGAMTEMISVQRALQSAAEVSKMYDSIITKATSEVGRL